MTETTGHERMSTAHSRELGAYLRLVRKRSDIPFKELLETLAWSAGKLSKLERGTRHTHPHEIAFLLGMCGADKTLRERIMALAASPDTGSFVRVHDSSPDTLFGLRTDEEQATTIMSYDPVGIPALVQTDDYTRALTDDEETVTARLERQSSLTTPSWRRVTLFLRETALSAVVGSTEVMRDQLLHLTLLSGTPTTVIRVIPRCQVLNAALCHPATLLTLDAPARPMVHVETDLATVFHDAPDLVAAYQDKFRQLNHLALEPTESRTLLARWANRYDAKAS
ncbi:helix-turn-helix transcriptional regulator [Saccharothrix xinjiangensis]|uniref:Helix-turn-helix domain-containing protein n=1 Tax=Saccharothrix xinjiangensis TaxID=204798 RepID=A0ABV9Y8C5_9PSEU